MSWLTDLFTGGVSSVVDSIGDIADKFIQTDDEKTAFKLQVQTLLQKSESDKEQTLRQTLESKERVLVAELSQGDGYTKRARPTVVYVGLLFIGINYVLFPVVAAFLSKPMPVLVLPSDFWMAWGGICATWSIGRTLEKRGVQNPVTRAVTGNKSTSKILD